MHWQGTVPAVAGEARRSGAPLDGVVVDVDAQWRPADDLLAACI